MSDKPFWVAKTLMQLDQAEWELLCDGCGKCCLHKLQCDETDEVFYTDIACRYLDAKNCQCLDYFHRLENVPGCVSLSSSDLSPLAWLPDTCSYRLRFEGRPLPEWHHLVTGSRSTIHEVGASVSGRVVSELQVSEDHNEEHIVQWV